MKDNTVKCPSCKEVFKVDDAVYNNIVNQVRDQQFEDELISRIQSEKRDKVSALKTAELELKNIFQKELASKQSEIAVLKAKNKSDLIEEVSKKVSLIHELESRIDKAESEKKFELQNAVSELEKQKNQLVNDVKLKEAEKERQFSVDQPKPQTLYSKQVEH